MLDLHSKEVIGWSVGKNKDSELVYQAFLNCKYPLSGIEIFHTHRGNEFKNKLIDEIISTFEIKRSLNNKGCPYDNLLAESFNHILKTECIKGKNLTA